VPGTPIRKGEFFLVSTLGFRVKLTGDARALPLRAADDAADVQVWAIARLHPDQFAVPDHLEMIHAAAHG
jgi:hypothetical protein